MKSKTPGRPSPEAMAKMQEKRTLSDADLIRRGAEYVAHDKGISLKVTEKQIEEARNEMQGHKDLARKIELPDDVELKEKIKKFLEAKLRTYEERRKEAEAAYARVKKGKYNPPEELGAIGLILDNTYYKIALVEELLSKDEVDTGKILVEMVDTYGKLNVPAFADACGRVQKYCANIDKYAAKGDRLAVA